MNAPNCNEVMATLEGRTASALADDVVEAHLSSCTSCHGEASLAALVKAADIPSLPPLTDSGREQVLGAVHATLGSGFRPRLGRRLFGYGFLVPAAIAAAAGVVAVVLVIGLGGESSQSSRQGTYTIATDDPALRVVASRESEAAFTRHPSSRRIALRKGTLYAARDRRAPKPKDALEIRTAHAVVRVVGTRFFVRSKQNATTVGVARGRVRVHSKGDAGNSIELNAGEQIQASINGLRVVSPTRQLFEDLKKNVPPAPEPTATPKPVTSPTPPAEPHSKLVPRTLNPSRSKSRTRKEIRQLQRRARTTLQNARAMLAAGKEDDSIAAAQAILTEPGLNQPLREELLYLVATAQRQKGDTRNALETLSRIYQASDSRRSRLARLESARILAREAGQQAEALRLLGELAGGRRRDAIAEDANMELCSMRAQQTSKDAGRQCFDEMLRRYPNGALHERATQMRDLLARPKSE